MSNEMSNESEEQSESQIDFRQRSDTELNDSSQENASESPSIPETLSEQFRKSWAAVITSFLLFTAGTCLLIWNECEAVKISNSLDEALRNIEVPHDFTEPSPESEGRLIYLSGPITITEPLTEPDYGVIISAVKLKRKAQMYQWIEIEKKQDSNEHNTHYYYRTEWTDTIVNSDFFHIPFGHNNPREMPMRSEVQIAEEVKIGAYTLGSKLKNKFDNFTTIVSGKKPSLDIIWYHGFYYHSYHPWHPKVGDMRIQFSYAGKAGDVYTVVGLLFKGTVLPFRTSNGKEVLLLERNKVGLERIFYLERVSNHWRTWTLRGFGWLVLFFAATCLLEIMETLILNSDMLYGMIPVNVSVSLLISFLVIGFSSFWLHLFVGLNGR